jgi:glycosyltransferase involved in cell wall biosynthesis
VEDLTILICAHGQPLWRDLAYARAFPSAAEQALTLVHYDPDATLAQVRNTAAQEADTEWLCFLDADDELDFGYVDAMGRHANADMLLAPAVKYINPRKATAPACLPNEPGDMRRVNRCVIGTLIRRETFWAQGGFKEWPCYEDWDLFLGAHMEGVPIVYVPDAVYKAHLSRGSRNAPSRQVAQEVYHKIRSRHGVEHV